MTLAKDKVLRRIGDIGIVPVVRAASASEAIAIGDAIVAGGIELLEITMTVPGAVDVMRDAVKRYGDRLLVGAGTVIDAEQTRACIAAGARFIVSPIVDEASIAECRRADIAVMPGALTPTEIVRAWRAGADLVKVFPCSAVGGAAYIKALRAPLPQIPLVPTGGVTLDTVAGFFAAGATAVGVGSDLCDVASIRLGHAHQITETARAYVRAVQTAREAA
jgi:2-dehydro-3-deoxyphosphogluconate aldolase/(4S)-4-hydroxy-2-oxoglutarate aldolase